MTPKPDGFRALDVETSLGALYSSQLGYKDKLAVLSSFFFFFFFFFLSYCPGYPSNKSSNCIRGIENKHVVIKAHTSQSMCQCARECQCETNEFSKAKRK
jgi:hypothetical protein